MKCKAVKFMGPKIGMKILIIGMVASLFGCSKTKEMVAGVLKDRGEEYTCAKSYPSLQIPKGIARDTAAAAYRIPEG